MPALAQRSINFTDEPSVTKRSSDQIPIELLLAIDQDYLTQAATDSLEKIAPKQLNRLGIAWLPVMDRSMQGWNFHVSFSNTVRANRLGKINDWVIIHYSRADSDRDKKTGKATIVTETHGTHQGERVVRGRESECFVNRMHQQTSAHTNR